MTISRKVYDGAAWQWPTRRAYSSGAWGVTASGMVWDGSQWASSMAVADAIPALQGAPATAGVTANGNALTVPMPAGIVAGEKLVAFFALKGTAQVLSGIPGTWASVTPSSALTYQLSFVFTKTATGSEVSWPVTWTGSATRAISWVARYSGVGSVESAGTNYSKGTAVLTTTVGSISTAGANRRLLMFGSVGRSDAFTWTLPGGMSQVTAWMAGSASSGSQSGIVADQSIGAGATGTRVLSWATGAGTTVNAWLVALAPPWIAP